MHPVHAPSASCRPPLVAASLAVATAIVLMLATTAPAKPANLPVLTYRESSVSSGHVSTRLLHAGPTRVQLRAGRLGVPLDVKVLRLNPGAVLPHSPTGAQVRAAGPSVAHAILATLATDLSYDRIVDLQPGTYAVVQATTTTPTFTVATFTVDDTPTGAQMPVPAGAYAIGRSRITGPATLPGRATISLSNETDNKTWVLAISVRRGETLKQVLSRREPPNRVITLGKVEPKETVVLPGPLAAGRYALIGPDLRSSRAISNRRLISSGSIAVG